MTNPSDGDVLVNRLPAIHRLYAIIAVCLGMLCISERYNYLALCPSWKVTGEQQSHPAEL